MTDKSLSTEQFLLLLQGLSDIGSVYFTPEHLNVILNQYVEKLERQDMSFTQVIAILESVHRYIKLTSESMIDTDTLVALTT